MLVLTRKESEAIVIGDPHKPLIRIVVAGIRGSRVRVGVDAPDGLAIVREELVERQAEGEKA